MFLPILLDAPPPFFCCGVSRTQWLHSLLLPLPLLALAPARTCLYQPFANAAAVCARTTLVRTRTHIRVIPVGVCPRSPLMNLRKKYKDEFEKRHGVKLGFMGAL